MAQGFIQPTPAAGAALFSRNIIGAVVMLNLLCFKETADYSANPELAPVEPISGRAAFQKYINHTRPFLTASGGELLFLGNGGKYLIGPEEARWDLVMLVKQQSLASFMAFASDAQYLAGMGHRIAALVDSRLLPVVECEGFNLA